MNNESIGAINLMDVQVRAMVSNRSLREFATALNNAFFHGDVFEGNISDDGLKTLYENIDGISKLAKKEDL